MSWKIGRLPSWVLIAQQFEEQVDTKGLRYASPVYPIGKLNRMRSLGDAA